MGTAVHIRAIDGLLGSHDGSRTMNDVRLRDECTMRATVALRLLGQSRMGPSGVAALRHPPC
jgi:hypothetical protein